jgi:molybdate transport system regulatory protein
LKPRVQFRLRITRGDTIAIGPGKIALLEAIARTGSISAAARGMGMSYRRAWLLVDEMNRALTSPVVDTAAGGAKGGGTLLTPAGEKVVALYRRIESLSAAAAEAEIKSLIKLLAKLE